MARSDYGRMLEVFLWGLEVLSRPTLRNLLASYEEFEHRHGFDRFVHRLEKQKLVQTTRRGKQVSFTITDDGLRRVRTWTPVTSWGRPWDGAWRAMTFDLPEKRRTDRVRLWRALRARKVGFLQRSVWVWPHPMEAMLKEIIQAEGIPECFCGFEARRLFLCADAEVVETAWDFEAIYRRQRAYEEFAQARPSALDRAADLQKLATIARAERQAYEDAFLLDPWLPRELWPKGYRGESVQRRHEEFRRHLRSRLNALAQE